MAVSCCKWILQPLLPASHSQCIILAEKNPAASRSSCRPCSFKACPVPRSLTACLEEHQHSISAVWGGCHHRFILGWLSVCSVHTLTANKYVRLFTTTWSDLSSILHTTVPVAVQKKNILATMEFFNQRTFQSQH